MGHLGIDTDHCGPYPGAPRVIEGSDAIEIRFAQSITLARCTMIALPPRVSEDQLRLRYPVGDRIIVDHAGDMSRSVSPPAPQTP
jgi:hypothetical protein